jgi:hypothetical protein
MVHTKLHCELHYVSWYMLHRLWYLGVVYTMDHEVVPRPCKSVDWLLNSSHDHFGLHQGKNVGVTMEVEVSKRHISRPK